MMKWSEIEEKFIYHPPSKNGKVRHDELALAYIRLCEVLDQAAPAGREKALAITKLQESKMWASAAVALNPETR